MRFYCGIRIFFRKNRYILPSVIIGIAAFIFVYGIEPLRFTGTGWIARGFGGDDITQHQTGWEFYRRSPWTFPLCKALRLGYPEGTSISYTDSIPIAALFFKIISPLLPESFQYFGLYTCLCFALQGLFSAALLYHFTKNNAYAAIGSIIFVTASCFVERCFRHTALSSHWLLLAALLLYFKGKRGFGRRRPYLCWGLLLCAAIGIHPYLFAMAFGVFAISVFEDLLRSTERQKTLKYAAAVCTAIVVFAYILGLFGTEVSPAVGFGIFSLNLNALFNPHSGNFEKWSAFVEDRPLYAGQADGIYYLGMSLGIVFLFSLAVFLFGGHSKIRKTLDEYYALLLLLAAYTVFALSNIVAFDGQVVFRYKLPGFILEKLSIFRASARFFFIPYYCIILFSLVTLYRTLRKRILPVIFAALVAALQVAEIQPGITELRSYFADRVSPAFMSHEWAELAERFDTALSFDCLTDRTLAFWLAKNDFKTNMMITAPIHMDAYWQRTAGERKKIKDGLGNGTLVLDANTVYIIAEDTGTNRSFENEDELTAYTDRIEKNYSGEADILYLTDGVKNYRILVPIT